MSFLNKILVGISMLLFALNMQAKPINFVEVTSENDTLTPEQLELKVLALTQKVTSENRLVDILTPDEATNLPVGIKKEIGGQSMTLVLDDMEFGRQGAIAKAYLSITFPGSDKNMIFIAEEVAFVPWGFIGGRLRLVYAESIDMGNFTITMNTEKTFVDFDCMGYKQTSLAAFIDFPESFMVKEDPVTRKALEGEKVRSEIAAEFSDFNDVLIGINIEPFQIKGLDGFGFYTSEAVIDLSDIRNPQFGTYTSDYIKEMLPGVDATIWRGFYLKKFEVKLPKDFEKDAGPSTGIGAEDMLFDEMGFTGKVFASNVLTLEKGSIAGWGFSMDKINLAIYTSGIDMFEFQGKIQLPVSQNGSVMEYYAFVDMDFNYHFAVSPAKSMNLDLFAAQAEIYQNSTISIEKKGGKFSARAVLHGKMNIQIPGEKPVDLAGVEFQEMTIQTEAPKFDIKSFSADVGKAGGFPIQVKNIAYKRNGLKAGIDMTVAVSLVKASDNGFSAEGGLTIYGEEELNGGISSWSYSHTEFNRLFIDIDQSAFSFKGELIFYRNDEVYGKGIKGMIDAKFNKGPGIYAMVQFGNVNDFRYWYCDAFVTFQIGMPLMPGIDLCGFGGGASYHMKMEYNDNIKLLKLPYKAKDTTNMAGVSLSGVRYIPDKSVGIGLKAAVLIGATGNLTAFNAKATFAMEFSSGGGLNNISFKGDALFMSEPGTPKEHAKFYAGLYMEYDFINKSLMANMEMYLNVSDALKGIGENGIAGKGQMYFSKTDWYIYLGEPQEPMGISMMDVMEAKAYFVTGTYVPGIPSPPSEVACEFEDIELDLCRDLNKLDNAGGFAFGASLRISTGKKEFMIFYGSFDAGIGFDLMLVNYGSGVRCEGSSETLGINGWYASGQLYAYFQGTVGMRIKLFGKNKEVDILDIGAAALLQAQLPNPVYMKGAVGGHYSVLNGLVKGNCNFEIEHGEPCDIVGGNALEGIDVIAQVSPGNGDSDVDVFSSPQVAFNFNINKEFEMIGLNDQPHGYRIKYDYLKIEHDNNSIIGNYKWNTDKTVLAFEPYEVLPQKSEVKVKVKVHFEEKVNGLWQKVMVDGQELFEERVVAFNTGEAPDYIPLHNVEFCYPSINQFNFYKNEYNQGYIQLKQGQEYLFTFNPDERWVQEAQFVSENTSVQAFFSYNSNDKQINYLLPDDLTSNKIYKFRLVNVPVNENSGIDENISRNDNILTNGDTLSTRNIDGARENLDVQEVLAYNFRTSKYSRFEEKLSSFNYSSASWPYVTSVQSLSLNFDADEPFDNFELYGDKSSNIDPLISMEAELSENTWYKRYETLLYSGYPFHPNIIVDRSGIYNIIETPPLNALSLIHPAELKLTEDMISSGVAYFSPARCYFDYMVSYNVYRDYTVMKTKAINLTSGITQRVNDLKSSAWQGEYRNKIYGLVVKYTLPGINKTTTSKRLNINY